MPNLVKESDGDQTNCGKKRQQPASSKGKGQKTLAVKTRISPPKDDTRGRRRCQWYGRGAIRDICCWVHGVPGLKVVAVQAHVLVQHHVGVSVSASRWCADRGDHQRPDVTDSRFLRGTPYVLRCWAWELQKTRSWRNGLWTSLANILNFLARPCQLLKCPRGLDACTRRGWNMIKP